MLFLQFFSSKLLMLQQGFGNIFRENSCSSLCLSRDPKKKKKTRRLPEIDIRGRSLDTCFFFGLENWRLRLKIL
jgi:hypothetical protein